MISSKIPTLARGGGVGGGVGTLTDWCIKHSKGVKISRTKHVSIGDNNDCSI